MIKVVFAGRRKPGMTHAEYVRYIYDVHGRIAAADPLGLHRYVQNHVFDCAFGKAAYEHWFHRDSVTELHFANAERFVATFTHPYTVEVVQPDGLNFSDMATGISMLTTEQVLQAPPRPGSAIKVMHYLKAPAATDDFTELWQEKHSEAAEAVPEFKDKLRGHIRSIAMPPAAVGGTEYFGGGDMPKYDGIASFWFADEADLEVFRLYETALGESDGFDRDFSFFLYTREAEILSVSRAADLDYP
jgi:hypothetical protein